MNLGFNHAGEYTSRWKVNYMCIPEPDYLIKKCLMEGYSHFLINYKRIPSKAKIYVSLVRKFHNYVGKSYVDVEERDIIIYLSFLVEKEHLKESSLYRHLAAINKFFEYLMKRGDIVMIPSKGISIKNCKK